MRNRSENLSLTLDNGALPFVTNVEKFGKTLMATIYTQEDRLKVEQVFDGNSDGQGDQHSAQLFRVEGDRYRFVGTKMFEFTTSDKIEKFYAKIGNSAVPYPVAVGEKYVYFMLDQIMVAKHQFDEGTDWADAYYVYYHNVTLNLTKLDFPNLKMLTPRIRDLK